MEFVKDKINQAGETLQGKTSEEKAKGDEKVLKDNNADLSTRATAATDLVGDKMDQKSHESKANVHDAKSEAR